MKRFQADLSSPPFQHPSSHSPSFFRYGSSSLKEDAKQHFFSFSIFQLGDRRNGGDQLFQVDTRRRERGGGGGIHLLLGRRSRLRSQLRVYSLGHQADQEIPIYPSILPGRRRRQPRGLDPLSLHRLFDVSRKQGQVETRWEEAGLDLQAQEQYRV